MEFKNNFMHSSSFGFVFYSFMHQWMKPFFGEGDSLNVRIDILSEWIDKYGNTIEQEEFVQIEEDYNNILAQARSTIDKNNYFKENGVNNYEEYLDYGQKAISGYEAYDYDVYSKMGSLIAQSIGYSSIYIQEYDGSIQQYKASGAEKGSILPLEVMVYTNNYLVNLAILCLLCTFFIAAPVVVNDRENHVVSAQYSSKTGRKTYRIQYICTMLSTLVCVSTVIFMGMLLWKTTGTFIFAASDLSSFLNPENFVVSITYIKYILLFIVVIYLLALGIGGSIFFLSAHSSNFISMLLKVIPVLTAGFLIALLLQDAFGESNRIYHLVNRKYCEIMVGMTVFAAGIFLNFGYQKILVKKECE